MKTCACMFMAASFIICRTEASKIPSVGEWVNKLRHIYTMGYHHSVTKRNELTD